MAENHLFNKRANKQVNVKPLYKDYLDNALIIQSQTDDNENIAIK